MPFNELVEKNKDKVSFIINSIIEMIKNPDTIVNSSAYFYRPNEKNSFLVYIYIFKLLINTDDYLEQKYNRYIKRFKKETPYNLLYISNIDSNSELDLLLKIKDKVKHLNYYYNIEQERIYFKDKEYIDVKWFLSLLAIVLDNTKNDDTKEINICYTIPNKHISKITNKEELDKFLSEFIYYNIKVERTDKTRQVRENNILIVKNAAINYLKHLKQFKHGLENEESYQLFYNLLINECRKEGFELKEKELNLTQIPSKELSKLKEYLEDDFYEQPLSKQVHTIENIIWQSSNDLTLLEHINTSLDSLIDLITILKLEKRNQYSKIKKDHSINDINILLMLIVNQFLLVYHQKVDEIDYSLIEIAKPSVELVDSNYKYDDEETLLTEDDIILLDNELQDAEDYVVEEAEEDYEEEQQSRNSFAAEHSSPHLAVPYVGPKVTCYGHVSVYVDHPVCKVSEEEADSYCELVE